MAPTTRIHPALNGLIWALDAVIILALVLLGPQPVAEWLYDVAGTHHHHLLRSCTPDRNCTTYSTASISSAAAGVRLVLSPLKWVAHTAVDAAITVVADLGAFAGVALFQPPVGVTSVPPPESSVQADGLDPVREHQRQPGTSDAGGDSSLLESRWLLGVRLDAALTFAVGAWLLYVGFLRNTGTTATATTAASSALPAMAAASSARPTADDPLLMESHRGGGAQPPPPATSAADDHTEVVHATVLSASAAEQRDRSPPRGGTTLGEESSALKEASVSPPPASDGGATDGEETTTPAEDETSLGLRSAAAGTNGSTTPPHLGLDRSASVAERILKIMSERGESPSSESVSAILAAAAEMTLPPDITTPLELATFLQNANESWVEPPEGLMPSIALSNSRSNTAVDLDAAGASGTAAAGTATPPRSPRSGSTTPTRTAVGATSHVVVPAVNDTAKVTSSSRTVTIIASSPDEKATAAKHGDHHHTSSDRQSLQQSTSGAMGVGNGLPRERSFAPLRSSEATEFPRDLRDDSDLEEEIRVNRAFSRIALLRKRLRRACRGLDRVSLPMQLDERAESVALQRHLLSQGTTTSARR
jgi:hypothetical protein